MTIKHGPVWKVIIAIAFVLLVMFVTTRVASQISEQAGEIVSVQESFSDISFFSGDEVNLKVNSTDDVFAAGGAVSASDTSADHLFLAGSEITATDVDVRDIIAAGGKITLSSGKIADDVIAAGGDIVVRPKFQIGGSAVFTGGNVKIEAPVATDLRAAARTVSLNSTIGGNAKLMGEFIEIGPKSRIGGDLLYRTENLKIAPGAVIAGKKIVLPDEEYAELERWGKGGAALFAVFSIALLLGIAVLVIIITVTVPSLMNAASTMIRAKPWHTLGIGLLITIAIPFAVFLLFATVIGVPLALLIGAIFIAVAPVAIAATSYFLGMRGREIITKKGDDPPTVIERLLWPALGAILILILGLIPYIGALVWLLALIVGIGAVIPRGGKALAQNA